MTISSRILAGALLYLLTVSACFAQNVLIPGSLTGPGTAGLGGTKRLCTPLSIGLYEWRAEWVIRLIHPSDIQMSQLRQLAADSSRAKEAIAAACGATLITKTTVQLAIIEQRLGGLVAAVAIIRPSYEAFYSSLDERQKARLDGLGPARRGWRW